MNSQIHIAGSALNADVDNDTKLGKIRSRRMKLAGVVLVAVLGVSACSSDPSAIRVAQDIVNTLATSDAQRDCMLDKLDDYGKEEIEEIAKSAQEAGPGTPLASFEADLKSCA